MTIDSDTLIRSVKKSRVLVLLLTKKALTRPWVLLEIYTALQAHIPIVPVGQNGVRLGVHTTSDYLKDLASNVFKQDVMNSTWGEDAWGTDDDAMSSGSGPTESKAWNELVATARTTSPEALKAMPPEDAAVHVSTPTGDPLTLEDIQATLSDPEAGLSRYKTQP